jgi:hypothetical protein
MKVPSREIPAKEPIFAQGDAVRIGRPSISGKNVGQWHQRELIPGIGTTVRGGRRFYTLIDIWRLALISEIVAQTSIGPGDAAALSLDLINQLANGKGSDERGFVAIVRRSGHGAEALLVPRSGLMEKLDSTRAQAVTIIPFTEIIGMIVARAAEELDREDRPAESEIPDELTEAVEAFCRALAPVEKEGGQ